MLGGIIAILFGVLSIVMFTQPVIGLYGQNSDGGLDSIDSRLSVFDFITFEDGQPLYHTIASAFLIASLVFAGITLLITLINLIARASNNSRAGISAKVPALLFFLCMLVAVVMIGVFCIFDLLGSKEAWDLFRENGVYVTVGWGMLVAFGSAFICLIFAPRKVEA